MAKTLSLLEVPGSQSCKGDAEMGICMPGRNNLTNALLTRICAFGRNHRTDSGSGGVSDFRPPPLTPSKAPWPDAGAGPKDAVGHKRVSQNSGANTHARVGEPAGSSGGIELVEGSYANGAGLGRCAPVLVLPVHLKTACSQ